MAKKRSRSIKKFVKMVAAIKHKQAEKVRDISRILRDETYDDRNKLLLIQLELEKHKELLD